MSSAAATGPTLRVEVLGPLRVLVDGTPTEVRGPKRRAVLAVLALAEGRVVTVDQLVDALWPDEAPDSARAAVQSTVSRLRVDLAPAGDRLRTHAAGYRLEGADLDLTQARETLRVARELARTDPDGAVEQLWVAHRLWRGPTLADLTDSPALDLAAQAGARLAQDVDDALVAAAVAAGRAEQVLSLATTAHAADPLREPAVLLLMQVLVGTGQAPVALRVGREYRGALAEETGLDPGPELGDLEQRIAAGIRPAAPPVPTVPAAALFGRADQVAALHRMLAANRLVSVVGPGGVGKTRIALEISRTSDPVGLLRLAPLTDPAALPHALAECLQLHTEHDDVLGACLAVLSGRTGLLLIDNCEHLVDAARDVVEAILSRAPGIRILVTSREPLGLQAEHTFRLNPLALAPAGTGEQAPAVAMFLDRAARVRRQDWTGEQLGVIAEVTRRLDGMPLAIELAAGRLTTFSLEDLRDRLDRSLDLLGGARASGDARHRTLRATVEWSYDLLDADGQRLFRHLSVLPDGADLATAEQIATGLKLTADPGTVLARLVDASMLEADFAAGTRYRMLETLRAFGLDRLIATGEEDEATDALLRWAGDLATDFGSTIDTSDEPRVDARLRRELPNLRAAWRCARSRGNVGAAAAMVTGLFEAIAYRDLVELRLWAIELSTDPALLDLPDAPALLAAAAEAHYMRGELESAEHLARLGMTCATSDDGRWQCLFVLAVVALARGEYATVIEHAARAEAGRRRGTAGIGALAAAYLGDVGSARRLAAECSPETSSPSMLAWRRYVAAEIEQVAGDLPAAETLYRQAIAHARTAGATFLIGVSTVGLLSVVSAAGRTGEALHGYSEVVDYFERTGNWTHLWATLRDLARLLRSLDDSVSADILEAAANRAPDAPAAGRRERAGSAASLPPGREEALRVAKEALARRLPAKG